MHLVSLCQFIHVSDLLAHGESDDVLLDLKG